MTSPPIAPTAPDTQTESMSRRDVWLTVALAVARDGLATPVNQHVNTTNDGRPMLVIEAETRTDALAWAAHLGIKIEEWHENDEGGVSTWGDYRGWRTNVRWTAPTPTPESVALTDRAVAVLAAIGGAS